MSRTNDRSALPLLAPALVFAGALAGCAQPDLYLDRRDNISFHAGDAIAANIVAQTIDPWPSVARNRTIHADGERMQAAVERYRTGKVYPPRGLNTSSVDISESPGGARAAVSN